MCKHLTLTFLIKPKNINLLTSQGNKKVGFIKNNRNFFSSPETFFVNKLTFCSKKKLVDRAKPLHLCLVNWIHPSMDDCFCRIGRNSCPIS